ncbi:LysR substrate binding domain-containing protein [Jannaschia seohaensis]|uniref:LysR substrate binding domain-containing protein n=2 Tax=Jannaschia seohaensis TaxID=475081 RepID=A0A2Y9B413_9RHOB|nr:LysR substrate binding domain-containing protein [Jannaschia seohaensis]SSA50745.1 LysR substrate binding domain-containing protein [Jannaschia seohaensis]
MLDHVRAMARGADMVSLSALGHAQSVEGLVRITASELVSAYILPPLVQEIGRDAPRLEIDIVADNGIRDLARREADIAIRHAMPDRPNLRARRLRDEVMRVYASAAYLAAAGMPTRETLLLHPGDRDALCLQRLLQRDQPHDRATSGRRHHLQAHDRRPSSSVGLPAEAGPSCIESGPRANRHGSASASWITGR